MSRNVFDAEIFANMEKAEADPVKFRRDEYLARLAQLEQCMNVTDPLLKQRISQAIAPKLAELRQAYADVLKDGE